MNLRDSARLKAQQSEKVEDWTDYKILRNICNSLSKKDKSSHFQKMFSENESGLQY